MNPLTALDPITSPHHAKTILAKCGFTCTTIMLAPGDETPRPENNHGEQILYVVEGEATVRDDDVNTVLVKDHALLIPPGKPYTIAASPGAGAKLLHVQVPNRQIVVPQILSFDRQDDTKAAR